MLELKNVSRGSNGNGGLLKEVSFLASPGTITGIIGCSGSGKTTLLRLIADLEDFESGEVRRPNGPIAMVFQQPSLWPHMTLLRNASITLEVLKKEPRAKAEKKAQETLSDWGLGHRMNAYPDQLSGGEQQRGSLVRAHLLKASLICLDEVTSALDPEMVKMSGDLIGNWKNDRTTIILATHQLRLIKNIADYTIFMEKGRIVEQGLTKQIFDNPKKNRTREFLRHGVYS